ncbi:hypothetical protein Mapa_007373 [Marchantia paleacea]|nr:hypothetical protein Mapa_007373 [Marchantia paleacea]
MKNPIAWPRAPHANKSTMVNPAGSLVFIKLETSCARTSPASKWVTPFWRGRPACETCLRWNGSRTNRPRKSRAPVLRLITKLVSAHTVLALARANLVCDSHEPLPMLTLPTMFLPEKET